MLKILTHTEWENTLRNNQVIRIENVNMRRSTEPNSAVDVMYQNINFLYTREQNL
jgi:hypothetical protein